VCLFTGHGALGEKDGKGGLIRENMFGTGPQQAKWDGPRKRSSTRMIWGDRQDTDTGRETPRRMAREGERARIREG